MVSKRWPTSLCVTSLALVLSCGQDSGPPSADFLTDSVNWGSNSVIYSNNRSELRVLANLEGSAENQDYFGLSVAAGDLNGDGYEDIAVGVPLEDIGNIRDAGAVNVIYGRKDNGLSAIDNQVWHQNSANIEGKCEENDQFGASVFIADFNGDGIDDLAIAVPLEDIKDITDAGAVNVIYGTKDGLKSTNNKIWHQNSPSIEGASEVGDKFGAALAAGDFNDDSYADLAIGVRTEDITTLVDAGAVNVLYGSRDGITAEENKIWHQNKDAIEGSSEPYDHFGASLAVGDFNGDGITDLAVGVPMEAVGDVDGAGAVNIIYGSKRDGLSDKDDQIWSQNSPGIAGGSESQDRFGQALAAGDFNRDGVDDLAVGVISEDIDGSTNAGAVNVIYGLKGVGLSSAGDQLWHQNSEGIKGACEPFDYFGTAVAAGDFNRDGYEDLAIGVPFEDISSIADAGAVNVIYGSEDGLTSVEDQLWYQDSTGIKGASENDDTFGISLAIGDFDRDGYRDLVIGVVKEDIENIADAGAVNVIYGTSTKLNQIGNQIWHQ